MFQHGIQQITDSMSLDSTDQTPAAAAAAGGGADSPHAPAKSMLQVRGRLHDTGSKFPKLDECAHFHYDVVELKDIKVRT